MGEHGYWNSRCYETVDWSLVTEDSNLIYRTEHGSWTLTFVSTVIAGSVGTVAYETLNPWIKQKIRQRKQAGSEELEEQTERLRLLFPFVDDADVFIGQRRPWVEGKLSDVGEYLNNLSASADGSMYDADHIGSFSANELLQTLEFLITTNVALHNAGPKDVFSDPDLNVDFSGDLISVGGPIPNYYTRNLMYGDEIDLPYRYDLNPDDGSDDTADIPPQELRRIGLADDRGFERRPAWCIVDRDGEIPRIQNRPTVPKKQGDQWVRDYFTITKVPNVHPDAQGGYGIEPTSLLLSGCHGLGTRAAIQALQTEHVLDTLESEAGDGYFQALGRVGNVGDNVIDKSQVVVPPEHVHVIDVE